MERRAGHGQFPHTSDNLKVDWTRSNDRFRRARRSFRTIAMMPVAVAIYSTALFVVYSGIIIERFRYNGLLFEQPTSWEMTASWLCASLVGIALPARLTRPSAVVLWVLFVVAVAPFILMSPYLGVLEGPRAVGSGVSIGAVFAGCCVAVRLKPPGDRYGARPGAIRRRLSPKAFWSVIAGFSLMSYGVLALTQGISLNALAISDVYGVRDDYAEALQSSRALGYLVVTQANVVNPLLIAVALYSRRKPLLLVAVGGQLILYFSVGFKTILFSVFALAVLALLFRRNLRPGGMQLVVGASLLIGLAAMVDWWQDGIQWSSLFARRLLFTPAWLTDLYLHIYGEGPWHLLGNSILSPFVDSPYVYGPAQNVSLVVTGSPQTSMNANVFADAFAQLGWIGVMLAGILLAILLRTLDWASRGVPTAVSAAVVVMPAVTLSNTSLLTSLLSHGVVVAVLLLRWMPRCLWSPRSRSAVARQRGGTTVLPTLLGNDATGLDP